METHVKASRRHQEAKTNKDHKSEMCDDQKDKHGNDESSQSEPTKHHGSCYNYRHKLKLHHSEEDDSQESHSTTEDSIFNDHHHDDHHHHKHPHQHENKQNHHCHSCNYQGKQKHLSKTSLSSSMGSSSSSSSSSSTTSSSSFSSTSSSSSSSSVSSFSSSLSSEPSGDGYPLKKSQHSQSCTDVSRRHRYVEDDDDDTVPLIDKGGRLNRFSAKHNQEKLKSSDNSPTKGAQKTNRSTGKDGSVRKAKSMESLSRPKEKDRHGNKDNNEDEQRKNEARKNLMEEKMKFSAFLNEITRQVLSPLRLNTLGVTDAQRPSSPGQASVRSRRTKDNSEKHRQSTRTDSISSSKHSQRTTHLTDPPTTKSVNHQKSHRSADSPHRTRNTCTNVSCLKRHHSWSQTHQHQSHSPINKQHHHHSRHHRHHEDHHSPFDQHRDHHDTSHHHQHHLSTFHHGKQQSPSCYQGNHHKRMHHQRNHCNNHLHGDHHNTDYKHKDRYEHHRTPQHHYHSHQHPTHHHQYHGDRYGNAHHMTTHRHQHRDHHNQSHNDRPMTLHDLKYMTDDDGEHCKKNNRHSDHENYHNLMHLHGDHQRDGHHHHHRDHHNEPRHHHGDHRNEPRHHHGDHHSEPCHHHGDHHSDPHHHHGDHHSNIHCDHHGDHHTEPHHHHGDCHSEPHHHHGDHHSNIHCDRHGDHHREPHHHHGDRHSEPRHHHGDHHSDIHSDHHGDHHSEPRHHHGDHHSDIHSDHHGDHHSEPHHHHGDHHSEPHHHHGNHQIDSDSHHHEDHHSEPHHHHENHQIDYHSHHHGDHHTGHQQHCEDLHSIQGLKVHLDTSINPGPDHTDCDVQNLSSEKTLDYVSPRNSSSSSSHDQEDITFTSSIQKETGHELGRIMILQEQNEGLQQTLLKTAVRMECLGEEFMSSQRLLEEELHQTRTELRNLTDRFKKLHDNCSSSQQSNNLLEEKLHLMTQSIEGERQRLNQRISALTEQLTEATFTNSMEALNVISMLHTPGHDVISQVVLPITPPPAQFMDSQSYGKDNGAGQEQCLGSVPEEEESDWSEMGEDTPTFTLRGSNRGPAWRPLELDMDRGSEAGEHSDWTPAPPLGSALLLRSASLEEIPLGRRPPIQRDVRETVAMMDMMELRLPGCGHAHSLGSDFTCHWRTSTDRETKASEGLRQVSEVKGQGCEGGYGWRGSIPDEVLNGERTQL